MTRKPRIAVTGPDRGGFPAWIFTALAVRRAGGRPLRLRPGRHSAKPTLPPFDGLILGGGADISPERSGLELDQVFRKPDKSLSRRRRITWLLAPFLYLLRRVFALSAQGLDEERDHFEERCLIHALEEKLPVFGICRGAQLINVHFHGTLHGDLKAFYGEAGNPDSIYPRKQVALTEGSRLRGIIGQNKVYVNSLHQQAVNHLGDELQICGRDKADVVQAIENPDHPFLIGVQWHPEYLPALHSQQRLFQTLVREAHIRSSDRGRSGALV